MKRGSLFFIALLAAIITFTGLNYALGRPGYYYDRYNYYNHHHCYDRDNRRYDERDNHNRNKYNDSTNSNY